MKIHFCPVCMAELIDVGMVTFRCPYCKVAFHISLEYTILDLLEAINTDNENNA